MPPYYDHPDYIRAMTANASEYLKQDYDHLLFSFHGIPERHLRKSDPTGGHCLARRDCCGEDCPVIGTCYRAQCFKTAEAFVRMASIPEHKHSIAFQSRLGRDPWLKPYTDLVIEGLAKAGIQKTAWSSVPPSSPTAWKRWKKSACAAARLFWPPAARN